MKGAMEIAREFVEERRMNPPEADDSVFFDFQQALVFSGWDHSWPEEEVAQAALAAGVPQDRLPDFMDSLSSWL